MGCLTKAGDVEEVAVSIAQGRQLHDVWKGKLEMEDRELEETRAK